MTKIEDEKRSGKRFDVSIPSRMRHGGFEQSRVMICNLSFRGFRAKCEESLSPGDFVSIDLPTIGLVRARIAWRQKDCVGGIFLKPTDIRRCV